MVTPAGAALLASIPVLLSFYTNLYRELDKAAFFPKTEDSFLPEPETFDFIIVGGGVGGSILANRLSIRYKVLLIEAGGDPVPIQSVPFISTRFENAPETSHQFYVTKQTNVAPTNRNINIMMMGKMLGGSSSTNGMIYDRGNPRVYDDWANITGDSSWEYKNIQKFFSRIENYSDNPGKAADDEKAGDEPAGLGNVHITPDTFTPGLDLWIDAAKELGLPIFKSRSNQIGFKIIEFAKKRGKRVSAYTSYIQPLKNRKNLSIYRYSYATRIVFEGTTAVGVEYSRHGLARVALASKEVLLCAGPVMSPILLYKSGVGPLEQIQAANATPVSILPVGRHVRNHGNLLLPPYNINGQYAWHIESNLTYGNIRDYKRKGEGPLSASSYASGEAFIASSRAIDKELPDLQLMYIFSSRNISMASCLVVSNLQRSIGTIDINATATSVMDANLPIINPNYYAVEEDFEITLDGIEFCTKALNTTSFRNAGAKIAEITPECAHIEPFTRDYWRCYIMFKTNGVRHLHGSCRMGNRENDELAVVDGKLRVIGVERLRVVDSSVMPHINVNPMGATMLVAEKAAADIYKANR